MCCLGIIRKSHGDLCKPDVATVIKAEKGGGEGKTNAKEAGRDRAMKLSSLQGNFRVSFVRL